MSDTVRHRAAEEKQGDSGPFRARRERVAPLWRVYLAFELLVFFVLTPIVTYRLLYVYGVPLFAILPTVFLFFVVLLTIDPSFSWRRTLERGIRLRDMASILAIFIVG